MNSLDQSDAEEALAEWLESANVDNAWKMAPTLISVGINANVLECVRAEFHGPLFNDAISWLEALVSSMQLVNTIEESIGRVTDLVKAVKTYAYEGKGQKQTIDINESIHATLVILAHKMREKEISIEKTFAPDLPAPAQRMHRPQPDLDQPPRQLHRRRTPAWTDPRSYVGREEIRLRQISHRPLHQRRRQRQRHPAREPAPDLRPLLHHQARRRRHRHRPRHRAAHRSAVRRHHPLQL